MNMHDLDLSAYSENDLPKVLIFLKFVKDDVPSLLGFDWASVKQCEVHTEHYMWCTLKIVVREFQVVIALNTIPFGVHLSVETYPLAPIDGGLAFDASDRRTVDSTKRVLNDGSLTDEAKIRVLLEYLCKRTVRCIGTASEWTAERLENARNARGGGNDQADPGSPNA